MALSSAAGTIRLLAADAVNTTYEETIGFQAKAIIFFWNGRGDTTDAVGAASYRMGFGFATSTTERFAVTNAQENGATAADADSYKNITACVCTSNSDGAVEGLADLSAIGSTSFTLIIDDQFATDLVVGYIAYGGDSITNVKAAEWTTKTTTGAGDSGVTGVGFQPDMLFITGMDTVTLGTTGDSGNSQLFFGAATGTADEHVWHGGTDEGSANMDTMSYCRSGEIYAMAAGTIGTATNSRASVTSFDTDGFTLTYAEHGRANRRAFYLAIKGGSWRVDNFATRSTTGSIVESSFGFTPTGVLVISSGKTEHAADTPTTTNRLSVGAFSSASDRIALGMVDEHGTAAAELATTVQYDAVYANLNTSDAIEGTIDVTSLDSDGFTLDQDDADASAYFAWYVAAGAVAGGDNITGSDTVTESEALTALQADVTRTDSATLTDTISALFVAWGLTESAVITEVLTALQAALSLTDSATATDTLTALQTDATGTDTGTLTDTNAYTVAWNLAETATVTDTTLIAADSTATDSATVSESLTELVGTLSPTESVTITDVNQFTVAWQLADTATLTDALTALHADVSTADTFTVTDTGNASEVGGVENESDSDTTTLTDTATIHADVTAADSLTVTEVGTVQADASASDSAAVTDTFSLEAALSPTENLTLTDTTGAITADLSLTEGVSLVDTLSYAVAWELADSATLTDTATAALVVPDQFSGRARASADISGKLLGATKVGRVG